MYEWIKIYSVSLCLFLLMACQIQSKKWGNVELIDFSLNNYALINSGGVFVVYHRIIFACKIKENIIGYRVHPGDDNSMEGDGIEENLGFFQVNLNSEAVVYDDSKSLDHTQLLCRNAHVIIDNSTEYAEEAKAVWETRGIHKVMR